MNNLIYFLATISFVSRRLLSLPHEENWSDGGTMGTRTISQSAIFNYNDETIWILGGATDIERKFVYKYSISTGVFTDTTASQLLKNVQGQAQYWTQIGNVGYILGDSASTNQQINLYIYDLTKDLLTEGATAMSFIPIPIDRDGSAACLTSANDIIYMVGGYDPILQRYSETLQMYDTTQSQWLTTNVSDESPELIHGRARHVCTVINNNLYAIGGYDTNYEQVQGQWHKSIEIINTQNILTNSFSTLNYWLIAAVYAHRAVVIDNQYIIVIGGATTLDGFPPQVQIIDVIVGGVTYGGSLNKAIANTVPILIGNTIYAFGGTRTSGTEVNTYQFLKLLSESPTNDPTKDPTSDPTKDPTQDPTKDPTPAPTAVPTSSPSNMPTQSPSNAPTRTTATPTQAPLSVPTTTPTKAPTDIPTKAPTDMPSETPTKGPSQTTNSPSMIPTLDTNTPSKTPSTSPLTPTEMTSPPSMAPTDRTAAPSLDTDTGNDSVGIAFHLVYSVVLLVFLIVFGF